MTLVDVALRNLTRHAVRNAITVSGVALAVAGGVALAAYAWGFERGIRAVYSARGTDLIVARMTSRNPMPTRFNQSKGAGIAALDGVRNAAESTWELVSVAGHPSLMVYGWAPGSFLWEHLDFVEGAPPTNDSDGICLGAVAAERFGIRVGQHVEVASRSVPVLGIFKSGALIENGGAVMPLSVLQQISATAGQIKHLNIRLVNALPPERIASLKQEIARRFRGLRAIPAAEFAEENLAIQIAKAMSLATGLIASAIAVLGVSNTMLVAVLERRAEIGTLLALGWCRRRILTVILIEAIALTSLGAVLGSASAVGVSHLVEMLPSVRGNIQADTGGALVPAAILLSLGMGLLGGCYPALRAASMEPCSALREP
jgi:putative ABC transport system permease protein